MHFLTMFNHIFNQGPFAAAAKVAKHRESDKIVDYYWALVFEPYIEQIHKAGLWGRVKKEIALDNIRMGRDF